MLNEFIFWQIRPKPFMICQNKISKACLYFFPNTLVIFQIQMEKIKIMHRGKTKPTNNWSKKHRTSLQHANQAIDQNLYEKFLNFMTRTKLQRLKQKLLNYYGRNFAIKYDDRYQFLQQWQEHHNRQQKTIYDLLQSENLIVKIVCIFIMITNALLVWAITVDRIFRIEKEQSDFLLFTIVFGMINRLIAVTLKVNLQFKRQKNIYCCHLWKIFGKDAICVVYFIFGFCKAYQNELTAIVEVFICLHLYLEGRKYYKFVRVVELALIYEYQFKIADLMINLLIIAHFLSLALFMATKTNSSLNWIKSLGINEQHYTTKYLYSIYFCCTTILTIGYGDITPKNKTEVAVVMMVEFFGVIIFGYLISQISHTLSAIRTKEQRLEKDLITLNKMQGYYGLEDRLINRTKGYLMANQITVTQLTPEEQNSLLSKFNEQLRNIIISDKSLAIVKTSIFFLCRWSKEMQTRVASHLQKALYAPKERLLQPVGQERIYIIKHGKIGIYLDRFGESRRQYRRLLKTINVNENSSISNNIYGYTAVISERICALNAQASEFTSCYFIEREDFLKCIHHCNIDFEYYNEIKDRIAQAQFSEQFEVPSILNIREHYNPAKAIIIRKELNVLSKLKSTRVNYMRYRRHKFFKHYFKNMKDILEKITDKIIENSMDELTQFHKLEEEENSLEQKNKSTISETCEDISPLAVQTQIKLSQSSTGKKGKKRGNEIRAIDNYAYEETDMIVKVARKSFHHLFEKAREYKNFFCNNNISEVLKKLENEHYNYTQCDEIPLSIRSNSSPQSMSHFFQGLRTN